MKKLGSILILFIVCILSVSVQAAITFVKSTSTAPECRTSGATNLSCSFATLPSVGSMIVVTVGCWNASSVCTLLSVTDNQGNTYTQAICSSDNSPSGSRNCIYHDLSIGTPSGTFTITVNGSTTNNAIVMGAIEYSVTSGPAILDITLQNISTSTSADCSTGTSGTTTAANELVVASCVDDANDSTLNFTTATTGYTNQFREDEASTYIGFSVDTKTVVSTGTQSANWTHDNVNQAGWEALLVTYKETAVAASCGNRLLMGVGC